MRKIGDLKKRDRKGQIQISFGMIVSIIITIVTLVVVGYVITKFVGFKNCADTGLFYNELQGDVSAAWRGGITQEVYSYKVSGNAESICFGNLTLPVASNSRTQYDALKQRYRNVRQDRNVFIYPPGKACSGNLAYFKLNYTTMSEFFCSPVVDGKVNVKVRKESTDNLVNIIK